MTLVAGKCKERPNNDYHFLSPLILTLAHFSLNDYFILPIQCFKCGTFETLHLQLLNLLYLPLWPGSEWWRPPWQRGLTGHHHLQPSSHAPGTGDIVAGSTCGLWRKNKTNMNKQLKLYDQQVKIKETTRLLCRSTNVSIYCREL